MIYRVNKIEDLRALETELTTEAIVVIDKVLPYNCSGVMFKTTKGWSKVFLDSTQLNRDATINGSLSVTEDLTVAGDFNYTPHIYIWDSANDGDTIPDDVDTLIVNLGMGDVNIYLPTTLDIGKKFTIVTETGGAPSSNKLYLNVSGMATINEGATSYFIASHQIGYAVCYSGGWIITK